MEIKKNAVINLQLSIVQLYIRSILPQQNILSFEQIQSEQLVNKTHDLLKVFISKLTKKDLLQQHQIILDIIQNLSPIVICSSCDCQLNVVNLKKLQDELLQNQFEIKFIL